MLNNTYRARLHYQDEAVADEYDGLRFRSWRGRIVHRAETRVLSHVIEDHFVSGSSVLDIPCGTGRLLHAYRTGGFHVTGCDISEPMLEHARQRFAGEERFRFEVANAECLPYDRNQFDYLVSYRFVLHLPPDIRRKVLTEMVRVTRRTLAVNFYFDHVTPASLLNRILQRTISLPPHRIRESQLSAEFAGLNLQIRETRKLGWFDKNWALVVLDKTTES